MTARTTARSSTISFCEYTYPCGTRVFSQSRHIRNCWNRVSEHVDGTQGSADISGGKIYDRAGQILWRTTATRAGHQQEQHDLLADLRDGRMPREGEFGAQSTLTAILGRLAAYSGQRIRWDEALMSTVTLAHTDALASLADPAPTLPTSTATIRSPSRA